MIEYLTMLEFSHFICPLSLSWFIVAERGRSFEKKKQKKAITNHHVSELPGKKLTLHKVVQGERRILTHRDKMKQNGFI